MKPFFTEADIDLNTSGLDTDFLRTVIPTKYISLDKANLLLEERGEIVYGRDDYNEDDKLIGDPLWSKRKVLMQQMGLNNQQALLINIEPIGEPDSAEKIVRDLANDEDVRDLYKRAKKLLEGK